MQYKKTIIKIYNGLKPGSDKNGIPMPAEKD